MTTGAAGSAAAVSNSGSSAAAVLNFTIPQGASGTSISAQNLSRVTIRPQADLVPVAVLTVPGTASKGYLLRQVTSGVGTCYLVTGGESIPITSGSTVGLTTPFAAGESLSVNCISSGLTNNSVPMSFVFDRAGSATQVLRVTIRPLADQVSVAVLTVPNGAANGYLLRQVTSGVGTCYLVTGSESIPITSGSSVGLATPFAAGESLSVNCVSSGLTNNSVPMSFVFDPTPQ